MGHASKLLVRYLRKHGNIPTVRVSSAQAKGAAKKYAYWGAVRYEIRPTAKGEFVTHRPTEQASSDRRSRDLAERDAEQLREKEGRLDWPNTQNIGKLSESDCQWIMINHFNVPHVVLYDEVIPVDGGSEL